MNYAEISQEIVEESEVQLFDAQEPTQKATEEKRISSVIFAWCVFSILFFIFSLFIYFRPHLLLLISSWQPKAAGDDGNLESTAISPIPTDGTIDADELLFPQATQVDMSVDALMSLRESATNISTGSTDGKRKAFVTLAVKEKDFIRSLVVARMLQHTKSIYTLVIFVHPRGDNEWVLRYEKVAAQLNAEIGHFPKNMNKDFLRPKFHLHKSRWTNAWVKLAFFSLHEEFSRLVYMDSDVYIARNIDELFSIGTAAFTFGLESGHADSFTYINSGLYVLIPSPKAENIVLTVIKSQSFPEGDQQVYKKVFLDYNLLPYTLLASTYNLNSAMCAHAKYISVVHLYHHKPWRDSQPFKVKPCTVDIIENWKLRQEEVLVLVHAEGIDTEELHLKCC